MLIDGEDSIYMLDRNNDVFEIKNLRFPDCKDFKKHLTDTLIDGVCFLKNDFKCFVFFFIRNLLLMMFIQTKSIDI